MVYASASYEERDVKIAQSAKGSRTFARMYRYSRFPTLRSEYNIDLLSDSSVPHGFAEAHTYSGPAQSHRSFLYDIGQAAGVRSELHYSDLYTYSLTRREVRAKHTCHYLGHIGIV